MNRGMTLSGTHCQGRRKPPPRPPTGGKPHNFTPTWKRLGIYYLAGVLCRGSLKGSGGAPRPLATALPTVIIFRTCPRDSIIGSREWLWRVGREEYRQLAPRQLAPNLIGQFQFRYFILTWVKIYKMELTNQIRCKLSWCELSVSEVEKFENGDIE